MATLPVEILLAIVDRLVEVDEVERADLSVLLRVSRQFYVIALPRLYQDITWPATQQNALIAFEKFHSTIKTNPGIQFITSYTFLIHEMYILDQHVDKSFAHVLPHLVNVRRLSLALPNYRLIDPRYLWSLPRSAQLTHLIITGLLDWNGFLRFAAICPTLEFITIQKEQTGQTTLSNSLLTNLRSLETNAANLFLFENMHSLVNLSTFGEWSVPTVNHVLNNFPALRTLWMDSAERHAATSLIPQYPNLEYLALGFNSVPETLDTTWLSRSKLTYIHFSEVHDPDPFEGVSRRIFNAVKSLVFFECYCVRTYKDGSTSTVDPFIQNSGWRGWWEAVQRDIERANRTHSQHP